MNYIANHPETSAAAFRPFCLDFGNLNRPNHVVSLFAAVLFSTISANATAASGYTNSASFFSSLPGSATTVTFDGSVAGTIISNQSTFDGIELSTNTGQDLIVSDHFDTSSPFNYLGIDDGFSNEFLSGDEISFNFNVPVFAFGLFIVGSPSDIVDRDFQLVAGGTSIFNAGGPERTLTDGGELYFLGLINPTGFTSARLNSFGEPTNPFFAFNLDDLTYVKQVPEPTDSGLFVLGILMLVGAQRWACKLPFVTL